MILQCKKIFYRVVVLLILMSVSHDSYAFGASRVNFDPVVNPMLTSSFLTNKLLEQQNLSKLQEVREAYQGAAIALAGLAEARRMERKWQRDALSMVYNSAENHYYQAIYDMVKNRIIPRLYRVAVLCVTVYPGQADHWLPTLFFICSDVQELCTTFSNIVTNGKLRFTGITFPQIAKELLDNFGITQLQGVDVDKMIDEIANFDVNLPDINMDDLKADVGDIVDFVGSMAQDTYDDVGNMWDERTRIEDGYNNAGGGKAKGIKVIKQKLAQVKGGIDSLKSLYEQHHETFDYKGKLQQFLGVLDSTNVMKKLFTYNDLPAEDLNNPINTTNETEQYYRQKWCIVKQYKQAFGPYVETRILDFHPDYRFESFNFSKGFDGYEGDTYRKQWYHFNSDVRFDDLSPADQQKSKELALNYVSSVAGVSSYLHNDQYRVEYDPIVFDSVDPFSFLIGHGRYEIIISYHFVVYQLPRVEVHDEEVYCEWFDSKLTSEEMFAQHMQSKLDDYRVGDYEVGETVRDEISDDKGVKYVVVQGDRYYYSVPDAERLEGVNSVDFIARCEDGGKLGEQQTQRKINEKHSPLNERSKEIMMENGGAVDDMNASLDEFRAIKKEKTDSITMLTEEIHALEIELEASEEIYLNTRTKEAREAVENLQDQIDELEHEVSRLRDAVSQIESCERECVNDYGGGDGGENIPDHMLFYQTQFPSLEWTSEGRWDDYTYIRKAKIREFGGEITFKAELSAIRDESYFLGIRYHRSIIGVHSSLTYESRTEETIAYMEFPKSTSAQDKAQQIEQRRQELQANYEDCTITIKENYGEDVEEDEGEVVHLLWPSDRLRIARAVFGKLNKIESRLILLEMMLRHTQQIRLTWNAIFNAANWDVTSIRTSSYLNNILARWRMSAREAARGNVRREDD